MSVGARQREDAFVAWYVVLGDGAESARRAGFAPSRAKQQAHEMLQRPRVKAAVEAAQAEIAARREAATARLVDLAALTAERTLEEVAVLAFSDIGHYAMDPTTGQVALAPGAPSQAMRAVQSVKFTTVVLSSKNEETVEKRSLEVKLWSKPESLRMAGDALALWKQRVELTGNNGGPMVVRVAYTREAQLKR